MKRSIGSVQQVRWAKFRRDLNRRIACLMKEERIFAGLSLEAAARKTNVDAWDLRLWENGRKSPIACDYWALLQHYGARAVQRGMGLDTELLRERYLLQTARIEPNESIAC